MSKTFKQFVAEADEVESSDYKMTSSGKKVRARHIVFNDKEKVDEAYGRRDDAYTRDYKSSVSGFGRRSAAYHADGGANDEGWDREPSHKPVDQPHSVHINGKKWKTFGSQSHATNVAKKIKGATVHKEEVELEEAVDPSEVAGNPRMYSADVAKKAYYHKSASASDKESLARHLDRYHGNKEWRKPVKEEALDESMTDSWTKVQAMDKGSVTGGKEEVRKRLTYLQAVHDHHKKFGNDTLKVRKQIEDLKRSRIAEELDEKLTPSMGAGEYIKDFQKSDAPQFQGKSKEKRRMMALAAYLAAKKSVDEELKGDQHKLDKNKNGKLDKHDFKLLRKEESELTEATVETKKYSWGTMKTVHHGASFSIPLHPEHHQAIAKLKDEQEHKFKSEDGRHWTARRKGDEVHFHSANDGPKTMVKHSALSEQQAPVAPTLDRKYIKGTPEHKAYKATKKPINGHPTGKYNEEVDLEEGYIVKYHTADGEHKNSSKVFADKTKAQAHADKGNSIDKVGGKYTVHKIDAEGRTVKEELDFNEEGDLMAGKISYSQFMEALWPGTPEYERAFPKRTTGRGARHDIVDTGKGVRAIARHNDDEQGETETHEKTEKRGRGRPAGSKSGARTNK